MSRPKVKEGVDIKLLVLGASGGTGRLVVDQALRRDHQVTALVRSAGLLSPKEGLTVVAGDACDRDRLSSLLAGHDAVISCLGQRSSTDASLLQQSAAAVIAAMQESDARRLVVVSQGLLFETSSVFVHFLRLVLARHVADSRAMEGIICNSELDWTVVRAPRLTNTAQMRGFHVVFNAMPKGKSAMSRSDLAASLLDEIDTAPHVRCIVGVTSR